MQGLENHQSQQGLQWNLRIAYQREIPNLNLSHS